MAHCAGKPAKQKPAGLTGGLDLMLLEALSI
jgi:hypothetical protein